MANPTEEDFKRVARAIAADAFDRYTLKHIAGNDYFRLVDGIASAIAAEREKAAKIAEHDAATRQPYDSLGWQTGIRIAAAIRAGDKEVE